VCGGLLQLDGPSSDFLALGAIPLSGGGGWPGGGGISDIELLLPIFKAFRLPRRSKVASSLIFQLQGFFPLVSNGFRRQPALEGHQMHPQWVCRPVPPNPPDLNQSNQVLVTATVPG
jgi:hypothetical protein